MSGSSRIRLLSKANRGLNMTVRQARAETRSKDSQQPDKGSRTRPVTATRFS